MSLPRVRSISFAIVIAVVVIAKFAVGQCPAPSWSAMDPVPFVNGTVRAMKMWDPDGAGPLPSVLVVGGTFTWAGSANVAVWNGTSWQSLGAGTNGSIYDLAVHQGDLIVGGAFTAAGFAPANRVARWNGSAWSGLGTGMNHAVFSLAVYGGELIAGGDFTVAGGVGANHIARWDGSMWQPLADGCDLGVQALVVYGNELVASGHFAHAGLVPTANVARWNGSIWQPLGSGIGVFFYNSVGALHVHDGELIAGGNFTVAGGVSALNVARWNGSVWQPIGSGVQAGVYALADAGADLIAAGANFITRWDGASWQPTGVVSGLAGTLASWGNGVLAGGNLLSVGGVDAPFLARLSSPQPRITVLQPFGPEDVVIANSWLIPGHEYFNLASLNPCAGGPGTGPYGGLCFNNLADLMWQLLLPAGAVPFHFIATSPDASFGPFGIPIGLSFEAICVNLTAAPAGCVSSVVGHTVQ
jgi:Domain of unknown function (DUF5122) beta-propeller